MACMPWAKILEPSCVGHVSSSIVLTGQVAEVRKIGVQDLKIGEGNKVLKG